MLLETISSSLSGPSSYHFALTVFRAVPEAPETLLRLSDCLSLTSAASSEANDSDCDGNRSYCKYAGLSFSFENTELVSTQYCGT